MCSNEKDPFCIVEGGACPPPFFALGFFEGDGVANSFYIFWGAIIVGPFGSVGLVKGAAQGGMVCCF